MKKNVMMRLAAILLVCVLASTCGISGTYAKYVTKAEGSDSARVAKWGVTVTAPGKTFSNVYKDQAEANVALQTVVSTDMDVNGEYDKVVAPGTEGTLSMFEVTGKPEVDVRVSYEATLDFGTNWLVDYDNNGVVEPYCPIVITVVYDGNTTVFSMANGYTTIAELEAGVEDWITNNCAVVYQANTDLTTVNDDLIISWKWFFEDTTPGNPLTAYQNDDADTDLGNILNDSDLTNDPTITFTIKCVITQVD